MKTMLGRKARLFALFALIAALPLAIWACGDGGDGTDGPTGPSTVYNPQSDYAGATVTAYTSSMEVPPGDGFTVIAMFKDGNGVPVEGIPLKISAENGAADKYFAYETNPTLTSSSGKASVNVIVSASCPAGSYAFVITPDNGPRVRGQVGIMVGGTTTAELVTGVTLTTSTPTITLGQSPIFTISATATSTCDLWFAFQAAGAGVTAAGTFDATSGVPWIFTIGPPSYTAPSASGPLTVTGTAYCDGADSTLSDEVTVQVNNP